MKIENVQIFSKCKSTHQSVMQRGREKMRADMPLGSIREETLLQSVSHHIQILYLHLALHSMSISISPQNILYFMYAPKQKATYM